MSEEPIDFRHVTLQALDDYDRQLKQALRGITLEEARWMPAPDSNHILWTLWHMARMEDMWGQRYLAGREELWTREKWFERLRHRPDTNGFGDTIEQVRDFPDVTVEEVEAYRAACREAVIQVIQALTADELPKRHEANWDGPRVPTVAWVLARIPVECSQHTGQIAYIRGMYASLNRHGKL